MVSNIFLYFKCRNSFLTAEKEENRRQEERRKERENDRRAEGRERLMCLFRSGVTLRLILI